MQQWFDNYDEIQLFEATTPFGHVLRSLKRPVASPFQLTRQEKVVFNDEHLLTLTLTRDFPSTEKMLNQMRNRLLTLSCSSPPSSVSCCGWCSAARSAPPGSGNFRRQQAEGSWKRQTRTLEERIKQRTSELKEKNEQLAGEIRQRMEAEHTLATEKERLSCYLSFHRRRGDHHRPCGQGCLPEQNGRNITGWTEQEAAGQPWRRCSQLSMRKTASLGKTEDKIIVQPGLSSCPVISC